MKDWLKRVSNFIFAWPDTDKKKVEEPAPTAKEIVLTISDDAKTNVATIETKVTAVEEKPKKKAAKKTSKKPSTK